MAVGVRLPAHHLSNSRKYALETWWEKCTRKEDFFKRCQIFRDSVADFLDDGDDAVPNQTVAEMLAKCIDAEGSLIKYILKNRQEVKDSDDWYIICQSAGWIIIQDYERVMAKGDQSGAD